ncbi:MAG: replication-relaxation family protein [Proteobacteria bacterium]|nr:replication-relaxation family protein [Pseudomonadota bacterium]
MTGTSLRGLVVQQRDRRLLRELDTLRMIDREQAKVVAGFGSTTRANARLLALTRAGLLRRFFTGTIGGGRKAVYSLAPKGSALIGVPGKALQRISGALMVGERFLEHRMRLNQIYIAVKHRPIPSARFRRWISFGGVLSKAVPIIPDGYFEIETNDGIQPLFVEVDLGTESHKRWQQKIRAYLQLAMTGEFRRLFDREKFRVLVIALSNRRRKTLRASVSRLTEKIFWFSTFDLIHRDGFWSSVWLRPRGEERVPLF